MIDSTGDRFVALCFGFRKVFSDIAKFFRAFDQRSFAPPLFFHWQRLGASSRPPAS
jgi:hypothetical protein